jgi:hypothetical protein
MSVGEIWNPFGIDMYIVFSKLHSRYGEVRSVDQVLDLSDHPIELCRVGRLFKINDFENLIEVKWTRDFAVFLTVNGNLQAAAAPSPDVDFFKEYRPVSLGKSRRPEHQDTSCPLNRPIYFIVPLLAGRNWSDAGMVTKLWSNVLGCIDPKVGILVEFAEQPIDVGTETKIIVAQM